MAYDASITDSSLTATKRYLLVDLSDTGSGNYPHKATGVAEILQLHLSAFLASSGSFRLKVGLLTENDGTNGSVYWLYQMEIPVSGIHTEVTADYRMRSRYGLELSIASDVPVNFTSNNSTLSDVNWKNDVSLTNAVGDTDANCAAGDIVAEAEEINNGGTFDLTMRVQYDTKAAA